MVTRDSEMTRISRVSLLVALEFSLHTFWCSRSSRCFWTHQSRDFGFDPADDTGVSGVFPGC